MLLVSGQPFLSEVEPKGVKVGNFEEGDDQHDRQVEIGEASMNTLAIVAEVVVEGDTDQNSEKHLEDEKGEEEKEEAAAGVFGSKGKEELPLFFLCAEFLFFLLHPAELVVKLTLLLTFFAQLKENLNVFKTHEFALQGVPLSFRFLSRNALRKVVVLFPVLNIVVRLGQQIVSICIGTYPIKVPESVAYLENFLWR